MTTATIELPAKLRQVFKGRADVRWARGGRGSAKTRSFAKMLAVKGYIFGMQGIKGQLVCGRQFMNSLEDSSLEECKRAIEDEPFLAAYYEIGEKYIKSRDGNVWFTFVGLDRSLMSIKSKGRILILWVDEAEPVTDYAWSIVIPTLREESEDWNAELWVTWNPKRENAPVELRFAQSKDPLYKGCTINYSDNKKFPEKLERDRLRDLKNRPDQYAHIWEGEFVTVVEGAYFARELVDAKNQGRIGFFGRDDLMKVYAFWDIGGTSKKSDATAIWIAQFIGAEVRVLNYYEAVGQPFASHVNWLRDNGYGSALCVLPHDGSTHDTVVKVTPMSYLQQAGFNVDQVKNQGAGAALQRIEALRRLFPSIRFNDVPTKAGRDAIGWYHEKRDQERNVGLGPNHDWSSHAADALGMMAVYKTGLANDSDWSRPINRHIANIV